MVVVDGFTRHRGRIAVKTNSMDVWLITRLKASPNDIS